MQACAGGAVVAAAIGHGLRIRRVDLGFAARHETDMHGPPLDDALSQPAKHPPTGAEALEIRVAWRTILAVIIKSHGNAQWGQCCAVETDVTLHVADCDTTIIKHALASPFHFCNSQRLRYSGHLSSVILR